MANPQPQLRRKVAPGYQLSDDIDKGYKDAVQGNQTNMALRYLELILQRQESMIQALRAELETLKTATPKAAPAPKAKEAPKSAPVAEETTS